jgi:hypothetical protein
MDSTLHREDTDAKSSHLLIHFTYGISPDHVVPLTCGLRTQPIVVVIAAQAKVLIFFFVRSFDRGLWSPALCFH